MPQARLPDVNTAFIKWRNKAVTALEAGKHLAAIGSLNNFNACLPEKYQVHVSDDEYKQKLEAEKLMAHCPKCDNDIDYRHAQKQSIITTAAVKLLTRSMYEKVWVCPQCKAVNLVTQSEFIKAKLPNPYYIGVVPDAPLRKDGIMDRKDYQKKLEHWAWTFLGELENKAAQFRDDSWQKAESLGYDIVTGDESQDD